MTNEPEKVRDVILLNGGKLIGKTRLQKSIYFLEAMNIGFGFEFDYHYYGPYSEDLSIASNDANALDLVRTKWERSQNNGSEYAIFSASGSTPANDAINDARSSLLKKLSAVDAITLELAATADFLAKNGFPQNYWDETKSRKSAKATPNRVAKAKDLLASLKGTEQA